MLNSSYYNLNRLGSPTAGDLINSSVFDAVGGSANYYKPSPPFNQYDPNLTSYNYAMHSAATLPRRRYSIGGLPSASTTEYLNLQQTAEAMHLSNLLNEAKTSITRSSQILSRGEDLSGDILLSAAAGDVIADMSHRHTALLYNDADITGANILNQMPITYSSQPNIFYAQPNYTNSQISTDLHLSRFKRPQFGIGGGVGSGSAAAAAASAAAAANSLNYHQQLCAASTKPHLANPILTAYTNPYFNSNLNTMHGYSNSNNYNSLPYQQPSSYPQAYQSTTTMFNPKYNQPPPPYTPPTQLYQPSTNSHYFNRPLHYTSNPVISQSSNCYYFKHHHPTHHSKLMSSHPTHANTCGVGSGLGGGLGSGGGIGGSISGVGVSGGIGNIGGAQTSTSASYLHHHNQHPYSGYSNQHFDHLNNSNCYSKLDLVDYTKQSDQTKRQVSFNIDVDTLSITS